MGYSCLCLYVCVYTFPFIFLHSILKVEQEKKLMVHITKGKEDEN